MISAGGSTNSPKIDRGSTNSPKIDRLNLKGTDNILVTIYASGVTPTPEATVYDQLSVATDIFKRDADHTFINSIIINPPHVYQPAVKIMGYNLGGDTAYKEMKVFIHDDNAAKLFIITYTAPPANFAKFLPVVNEMIKSFRPVQVR